MKKNFALGLAFLLCSAPQAKAMEDVFDLAAKYNATKKGVTELESQKRKILSDIYAIEKENNKLVLQKSDLDNNRLKLDGRMATLSRKIIETEERIQVLLPELVERVSFVEQVNQLPWIYTIMTSQSLAELDTTFATAEYINAQQGAKIAEFLSLIEELKTQKSELEQTALEIVKLQRQLRSKEKQITLNQQNKKIFLKQLEVRISKTKKELKKLKGAGQKALAHSFFKDLKILFGSQFFDEKGRLPHPIPHPPYHGYGLNKELLKQRVQLTNKGYFYRVSQSTPVKVVAAGRVRHIGTVDGFGQVVVVDHGSHYYTTYASLSQVEIKPNQEVEKGQQVGLAGYSHLQFGPGLYFEIRHFSQPQNPDEWLVKPEEHLANL